ncbi:MAG: YicC family protein [Clostridia bacterium]|nr:YicC family protein [Clostridia bacterium]
MIKSMTGYGRARKLINGRDISCEIKSVNNRYLEQNVRINRIYASFEERIKKLVSACVARGKVDIYVSIDNINGDPTQLSLNREYLDAYLEALRTLKDEYGIIGEIDLRMLAARQEIFVARKPEEDLEAVWTDLSAVVNEALEAFTQMREKEGARLCDDISARLGQIGEMREKLLVLAPASVKEANARMCERVKELLGSVPVDESRLLTECAVFADRCDVTEELVRLGSHLSQFGEMLEKSQATGKKMDFLVQEINREINTTGSKCNDTAMAGIVIDAKAELEKIREQIQNIE